VSDFFNGDTIVIYERSLIVQDAEENLNYAMRTKIDWNLSVYQPDAEATK
jgi:hypothetical protein